MKRIVATGLLGLTVALGGGMAPGLAGAAHADDNRTLAAGDFYGYQGDRVSFQTNDKEAVVAGDRYARAVRIQTCGAPFGVSFNARRFPGYKAISFSVGIADRTDVDARATFTATADGKAVYKAALQQGQIARRVTIAFGETQVLSFSALQTRGVCTYVLIGNPIVVHDRPTAVLPPAATSPRLLFKPDFYGYQGDYTTFETRDAEAVVAGDRYARAVRIQTCGAPFGVSLNAARLRGYNSVGFDVGIADRTDVDARATFTVTADGKVVYKAALQQGQLAQRVTIPFGKAEVLSFSALQTKGICTYVLIGNPVALP